MVRALILTVSTWLVVGIARADLQFTPKIADYELDGVKLKQLAFSDGNAKDITYAPPRGWDYSGNTSQLTLRPRNKKQAEATISKITLPGPVTFDEETAKELVKEMMASLPHGSTNVQVVSQEKNRLLIERKETFLVTLGYTLYGERYSRSILFLNRGNEQIRFQLACRQADFEELQKAFLASHYSWQNL
jgi:hypothetical protein